jgi:hypothetical protein
LSVIGTAWHIFGPSKKNIFHTIRALKKCLKNNQRLNSHNVEGFCLFCSIVKVSISGGGHDDSKTTIYEI